jgi:hypothetical protein
VAPSRATARSCGHQPIATWSRCYPRLDRPVPGAAGCGLRRAERRTRTVRPDARPPARPRSPRRPWDGGPDRRVRAGRERTPPLAEKGRSTRRHRPRNRNDNP